MKIVNVKLEKENLNVYFCIVLSDCKVKREIPFKKRK